ncbi:TMEM164 family acyltransferase [Spiroplasma mirum]|nr:YwaF family protein [Spiroplasma atrichopogonis]AKM52784.1 hypothetical protein SATRI_v1c02210 [Spiroplasma atrichopogonis]
MRFIPSSKGPWGFFDPAGNYMPNAPWGEQWFVKGHSYVYQLIGVAIFLLLIGSLFIFKRYYQKTVNFKWFRISIGVYQIASYFAYYIMMAIYLATVLHTNWLSGPMDPSQVRSLSEMMPLHLCSIHQILSGLILIFPSARFFKICAPSALILPILAIITPVNGYWTPDNFFFYNYFILHSLIIFAYIYVYKYGLVEHRYSGLMLRWELLWLTMFLFVAVIWDGVFQTNMLYVGPNGSEEWNKGGFNVGLWNTNYLGGKYLWPFSWIPMFFLGLSIISLTHIMLFYFAQSYHYDRKTKTFSEVSKAEKQLFKSKHGFKFITLTFKFIFLSNNKIKEAIRQYEFERYYVTNVLETKN